MICQDIMEEICRIDYKGELVPAAVRYGKGSFYRTKDYREAREALGWHYKAACHGECRDDRLYKVVVEIFEPGAKNRLKWRRADIDNYIKPILDSATGIIWKDDVQVTELKVSLHRDADSLQTKIVVYDIGSWHRRRATFKCQNCGKAFTVIKSLQRTHFCSQECYWSYLKEHPEEYPHLNQYTRLKK